MYQIGKMPHSIDIGYIGETNFRQIDIDMTAWMEKVPDGVPSIVHIRPGESKADAYVADTTFDTETNVLTWVIKDSDIGNLEGEGVAQIWLEYYEDEEVTKRGKSVKVITKVTEAADDPSGEIPSAQETMLAEMTSLKNATVTAKGAAEDAQAAAEAAAEDAQAAVTNPPYISEDTGCWMVWSKTADAYVDTGISASGDPALIIDDEAGEGDTDKTFSADKLTEELGGVKNAYQGLKDDTEENFANLVTIINGYDYLNETLTEGKYAKYSEKATPTLSECNVLEFDVTHVAKFQYTYFIANPDARGLFFTDKDDNYISGVQTKSAAQNITVPSGAVKCYATVTNSDNIVVYEIYAGDPPVELLKDQATYTDKDNSGGIKYTWASDHKTIKIKGTRTGTSYDQMAGSSSTLPTGIEAGKKYLIQFDGISANINCALLIYVNGSNTLSKRFNKPTKYTIPSEATGLVVRLEVNGSGAVVDETVNCPEIYTVPDVKGLDERVTALEHAAYTDDATNPLAYIRRDAGFLSLFHTVGCIGDSLSSGESAYKSGGTVHYVDRYAFSWGQCLARLTGNTYYNFSQGGLSSKTWLTSQHCTDCFDGNHTCDMYFIGLGQNDKNQSLTVGTTADINLSDYTQNADTYCGNMGQIIQRLQILQPKAPIFVFIDPAPPSGDQAYNNVIPSIVELFDNVWIIDLKTYAKALFTEASEIIGSQLRSGHYSALGYQEIAFVIATYVDWIVRNNLSDFSQVEFIGTNYEWTT